MIRTLCCLAFALTAAAAGPATAAPQILGVVATADPVPMHCDGGECTAMLSAFCLQEQRPPPDYGTAYLPAAGTAISLVVTAADGGTRRLDAVGLVELRSEYGYTAIRASLPRSALAAIDAAAVAIEVGPLASVLPRPQPGDADSLADAEIALATGPLRLAAAPVMEGSTDGARAARLTAAVINALPRAGDVPAADRDRLWSGVAPADAPALARRAFAACGRTVDQSVGYTLHKCLEERHQGMQVDNTRDFRDSLAGS